MLISLLYFRNDYASKWMSPKQSIPTQNIHEMESNIFSIFSCFSKYSRNKSFFSQIQLYYSRYGASTWRLGAIAYVGNFWDSTRTGPKKTSLKKSPEKNYLYLAINFFFFCSLLFGNRYLMRVISKKEKRM